MPKDKGKSANQLQHAIKEKMSELGISVHALEKQAGLKRSAVQNILQGRSKNPSVHILHAVAKILGCNINDLLAQPEVKLPSHEAPVATDEFLDLALYAEAAKLASVTLNAEGGVYNAAKAVRYIKELYQYSVDSQLSHIDKNFASWLAGKLES